VRFDVTIATITVAIRVPNEEKAIAALVSRLGRYRLERIVVEATGRLEQPFVRAAIAKGLPVVVVSPLKVRRFAGAVGQLAKTDEIDARLIAQFAAALKPVAHPAADPKAQLIKDLVVRRRQLTSLRTMEKNRRPIMPEALRPSIDRIIKTLNREIESLEQLIQNAVEQHTAWRDKRDLLTSMPGGSFDCQHVDRRSPRTRLPLASTDRSAHRRRTVQPRQRHLPWQTSDPRRSNSLTYRALPQRYGRGSP
jgi:transposase